MRGAATLAAVSPRQRLIGIPALTPPVGVLIVNEAIEVGTHV